jgi:hypothetical protein
MVFMIELLPRDAAEQVFADYGAVRLNRRRKGPVVA